MHGCKARVSTDVSRPQQDQFAGALIGCAVGDALGAPIEGQSRERIASIKNITDGYRPYRSYPLGQYTDDTQLTIAIATSLTACGRVDGADIAREFVKLWESGEIIGAGPVADRAVRRMMQGIDWQDAAAADDPPLNGAAMRIAPIGLWNCDQHERLADDVTTASVVTHRHPLAIDSAMAVATAVVQAVATSAIDQSDFLAAVASSVADGSPEFARRILELGDWLDRSEEVALRAIAEAGPRQNAHGFGIPAMAEPTVLAALYGFLMSPRDFVASVDRTLRIGGDVDTIAAITGAISGAHNGIGAIPPNLVAGVRNSADIQALGRRLFARRFG